MMAPNTPTQPPDTTPLSSPLLIEAHSAFCSSPRNHAIINGRRRIPGGPIWHSEPPIAMPPPINIHPSSSYLSPTPPPARVYDHTTKARRFKSTPPPCNIARRAVLPYHTGRVGVYRELGVPGVYASCLPSRAQLRETPTISPVFQSKGREKGLLSKTNQVPIQQQRDATPPTSKHLATLFAVKPWFRKCSSRNTGPEDERFRRSTTQTCPARGVPPSPV